MKIKTTYQNFFKKTIFKSLFALCVFFTAHNLQAQTMLVDFENPANYSFGSYGGASCSAVANPDATGINISATVAEFLTGVGNYASGNIVNLNTPQDYSDLASLLFKIKAANGNFSLIKLLDGNDADVAEGLLFPPSSSNWANMSIDMTFKGTPGTEATATYSKILFVLNPDGATSGEIWYVDSIANSATLSSNKFNQDSFEIYPNPVSEVLKLKGSQATLDGVKLSILNITGQLIKTTNGSSINVSDIKTGLYLVSIQNNLGQVVVKKFVKE